MTAPTADPADGVYLYAESGVAKVRQANGTVVPIAPATVTDAGVWSGGNASSNFTGQPLLRAGGAG